LNRRHVVGVVLLATMIFGGCASSRRSATEPSALNDDAITVGSFDFDESVVLAEVYTQALEAAGYTVVRAFALGPREFVAPALERGLIEFVPEYAGTATTFFSLGRQVPAADAEAAHDELARAVDGRRVSVLASAPAEDVNTFVVSRTTADRLGLRSISDLVPHARELTLGGPRECPTRPLCLAGLHDRYGLGFRTFIPLDPGGPVTRQSLRTGNVDVGMLLSTDPAIDGAHLVGLVDDRGLQPADNVTPLVRTEVVDRWGSPLVAAIDAVSALLTSADVRQLDEAMSAPRPDVTLIAATWLRDVGLG
jgi:osmoprotectant transport system substrate-binding protein